ncbi:hypothetical protein DTO027B5_4475 [Paecilomyces variotii]|nr:hypothetical protein DTO027B3_5406 [Paecilomyces variotii]KAJ9333695.1 hypothetical protein DTO027B5_4475 [Paecilomyces variotii]
MSLSIVDIMLGNKYRFSDKTFDFMCHHLPRFPQTPALSLEKFQISCNIAREIHLNKATLQMPLCFLTNNPTGLAFSKYGPGLLSRSSTLNSTPKRNREPCR